MERIGTEFADILDGRHLRAERGAARGGERDALAALPRLHFRFDRRSLGRLRMLIDVINVEG